MIEDQGMTSPTADVSIRLLSSNSAAAAVLLQFGAKIRGVAGHSVRCDKAGR